MVKPPKVERGLKKLPPRLKMPEWKNRGPKKPLCLCFTLKEPRRPIGLPNPNSQPKEYPNSPLRKKF